MLQLLLTALLLPHVQSAPAPEAEAALQEDWFSRALGYMDQFPETVEGEASLLSRTFPNSLCPQDDRNVAGKRWPTAEIPFVVSPDLESRLEEILSALRMLSEGTCVSFHRRTSETNFLLFKPGKGCASYVGFTGGEQPVYVAPSCKAGNIAHEVLHALGFHHEHTRTDREDYVTVMTTNIMKGMEKNFAKFPGETLDLDYDINSILHYGGGFFSSNGLPTIVPVAEVKTMGQRKKLTQTDVKRVRRLYGCDFLSEQPLVEGDKRTEEANDEVKGHVSAGKGVTPLQFLNAVTRGRENPDRERN
ncbi:uncharacterized protein V6R79_014001 [Siganus canaliculatus]